MLQFEGIEQPTGCVLIVLLELFRVRLSAGLMDGADVVSAATGFPSAFQLAMDWLRAEKRASSEREDTPAEHAPVTLECSFFFYRFTALVQIWLGSIINTSI